MNEPILLSKRDGAALLAVSLRTIENLIAQQELPVRHVGRRTLIPYRALEAFAKRDHATGQHRKKPAASKASETAERNTVPARAEQR